MTRGGRGQRRRDARSPLAIVLALLVVTAAACAGRAPSGAQQPTRTTSASALPPAPPPAPIAWSTCAGDANLECGSVTVPLDYRHPLGPTIQIAVSRAPAVSPFGPVGTLVVNPGGPGESGNQLLPVLLALFPPTVRQQFDIVTFDPRGIGTSDPLRCGTSPSAIASVDPVPAAGQPLPGAAAFATMAHACEQRAPSLAPFVNTVNTARDMDRIRQALGLSTISYYGLSYGTELGAVYADLFPHRVHTMVLDGAVDVNAPLSRQAAEEAPAAERSLEHLFATCRAATSCPLGPHPRRFFETLTASLARHPLSAPGHGDPYPVTVGDLDTATLFTLTVPASAAPFYQALTAAHAGNGIPLRTLALEFEVDLNGEPLVDPLWAITCNDAAVHPGARAAGALARSLSARYPLIGGYIATYTLGGCVSWPAARHPVLDLHPNSAPPTLVIGNTGDPNTPLVDARHLAAIFPTAAELTWNGYGHTWLLSGPTNQCMSGAVVDYLVHGVLPSPGTVCGSGGAG